MIRPERSTYTPLDFRGWNETGALVLSPKFQRRGVWTTAARSYLIESLLLGMPVPPIYLRIIQNRERNRVIREVIDGQQRIAAVLDYVSGKYGLSKSVESEAKGKRFAQLTQTQQDRITQYSFICEVFQGIEDRDVLQIFARLNTYSVKLNAQELRNGRFFGPFKQAAYALALDYLEFWRTQRIFTERKIARMGEVELTSELLILGLDGLQDKKKSIDHFYDAFDVQFPQRKKAERQFRLTVDALSEACGEVLPQSEFHRPPLFYSLYACVYHRMFGLQNCRIASPVRGKLTSDDKQGVRDGVGKLSSILLEAETEEGEIRQAYKRFVAASLRQTDNVKPRQIRLEFLYNHSFGR